MTQAHQELFAALQGVPDDAECSVRVFNVRDRRVEANAVVKMNRYGRKFCSTPQ